MCCLESQIHIDTDKQWLYDETVRLQYNSSSKEQSLDDTNKYQADWSYSHLQQFIVITFISFHTMDSQLGVGRLKIQRDFLFQVSL